MILKRVVLGLVMTFLVLACNGFDGPEKPKDLLSKNQMVNILIDSKLITSANSSNTKTLTENHLDVETYVFKKHNIDSLQFATSNAYYAYHTELYEAIYNKAIDSLERLELKLKEIQAEEWKSDTK